MAEKQVKSRQRVADHGEVFTAEREVRAMSDLVKSETERIESRFLEPACGNGNFCLLYTSGSFLIYQPMLPIFIPQVAVNHSAGQVLATHAF